MRRCLHPGCPTRVERGRCAAHESRYDRRRGTARERGYDWRWQNYARRYLIDHPLCAVCLALGHTEPATCVDHIEPHRGNAVLFLDTSNHQALCGRCHGRKTATEDGGFR